MTSLASTLVPLEDQLDEARRRIEVTDQELDEARKRRNAIAAALKKAFPGSRIYVNGSIAHGDALTPLTDVDLGVVVLGAEETHGPGLKGPSDLKDRAVEAIRRELKEEYPGLIVIVEGQKRAILVRFRDPVTPGQPDFTADVIVAVDNTEAEGLFIPRFDGWDRSHPEKHTELVRQANEARRSRTRGSSASSSTGAAATASRCARGTSRRSRSAASPPRRPFWTASAPGSCTPRSSSTSARPRTRLTWRRSPSR